ncbi:HAMP domain-containing sensor histidine kinase [Clostridiaceae bacterium M8S5]|nr:HAMP domain-containing sensor histidine kinase [Clostridiaceae bacterium M8S5]
MTVFRNREFKSFAWKLILVMCIFALFTCIYANLEIEMFNNELINHNTAIVGQILSNHPELKTELPKYFTSEPTDKEIELGRSIMKTYGYHEDANIVIQPTLSNFYSNFSDKISLYALFMLIPILLLTIYEYRKIYKKIKSISLASEKVIDGDFSYLLPVDIEGDFGILYNNFNQMAHRLKLSLDRLNQDKIFLKNIISDISHQLKTPLASLIMFNDILIGNEGLDKDDRRKFLEKSNSQLNRMQWLIISLLKMTRLEAGVIEFKKKHTPLISPIKNSVDTLMMMANKKNQTIKIFGDTKNVYLNVDSEWLSEALINIIKNCIEHTDENGKIDIYISETPLLSQIVIRDTGEGIAPKDIPHIFERFYAVNNSVKSNSIGIGLALSKLIIEGQNGSISVRSKLGKGTEFTITFLKKIF